MKKRLKKLLKHPATQGAIAKLIAGYVQLVWATSRITLCIDERAAPYAYGEANGIFCFWHGRLLMVPKITPKGRMLKALVSQHSDGELIARAIEELGMHTIRGSSSKGARAALRAMLDQLEAGSNIAITPDGPRGPFQVAAPGAAQLAKLSGKPIIPASFGTSRGKQLESWDKFVVAWPFSRITYIIGAPLTFEALDTQVVTDMTEALQAELIRLTEEADARCL